MTLLVVLPFIAFVFAFLLICRRYLINDIVNKKKKKNYHQTRKEKKGKTDVEGYYSSLVQ